MKKMILSVLALLLGIMAPAQQLEVLPIDSSVRVGKLDNGLTYYIRHNEQPKQRAEFHIAQAVGAILEEDNQNGLAHFLEHMAFNGTEHFPGKGIITYFESNGVTFGNNINAYTSLDETVYNLSDVPTYREGIIDSALLVLHDWSCGLSLLPEEIDAERGVIMEEWRTRSDANRRLWTERARLMYPGSQYSKRDVVGDTAVILHFSHDLLRAYYKKWYGPDNQAIVVVGDVNVDQIEGKIKALWGNVPERVNRGERPIYPVNDNEDPIVVQIKDKEAQYSNVMFFFKKEPLPANIKGTNMDYVQQTILDLITDIFNERISELSQDPEASFAGGGSAYYNLVKSKDAFLAVDVAKPGQETQAYKDLVYQIEKMRRYGFTVDELERAKAQRLTMLEKAYNERETNRNIVLTKQYIRHYLDGALIPGAKWNYEMGQQLLPALDLNTINMVAKQLITDNNVIIVFTAPESAELPTKEMTTSIFADAKNLEIAAPVEQQVCTTLVEKAPKAGKIRSIKKNDLLGTTEWVLSNGIKVVLKPTQFKQDEILFSATQFGGLSMVKDTADLPSATLAADIIGLSGIGNFSNTDLQKALTGKYVSMSPEINKLDDQLSGSSNVRDLETMLQLVYLYFTAPRRDEKAFQTLKSMMETQLKNKEKNPKAIWMDSIRSMCVNNSPRLVLMNMDVLHKVDLDKALQIYSTHFACPSNFLFTFTGNINPDDEAFQQMVCTWLGGMKSKKYKTMAVDNGIRAPKGEQKNYFTHKMLTPTASNYIQYTAYNIPYSLENILNKTVLQGVLDTRYLESIREREGGSYGVNCYSRMTKLPVPCMELIIMFDTDPLKQEKLMGIIHEEIQTILKNGPLTTDVEKEKAALLKKYDENIEKNSFWSSTILSRYYLLSENYLTDYKTKVANISEESVRELLQKLVSEGNMFEIVMLPE